MLLAEVIGSLESNFLKFMPRVVRNSVPRELVTRNNMINSVIVNCGYCGTDFQSTFTEVNNKQSGLLKIALNDNNGDGLLRMVMNHPATSKVNVGLDYLHGTYLTATFSSHSDLCNYLFMLLKTIENWSNNNNTFCVERVF